MAVHRQCAAVFALYFFIEPSSITAFKLILSGFDTTNMFLVSGDLVKNQKLMLTRG
jgi:hypothetical protein